MRNDRLCQQIALRRPKTSFNVCCELKVKRQMTRMANWIVCIWVITGAVSTGRVEAQTAIQPVPEFKSVIAADGKLGSTMTLQNLQSGNQRNAQPLQVEPIEVRPAAEPVPALRIRLYPAPWERKPGQALLHYNRALIHFSHHRKEDRLRWQSSEWLEGQGDGDIPGPDELKTTVDGLQFVYDELHELALSEDFDWDHRLRDIRGPQVYMYLLPDVQEIRTMARMLVIRIRYHLSQDEFEEAFSAISDGLRLAEFVGQGETLIQKLVGIAISSMMRDQIENAISRPGCPNLYWAIATIPRPLINVRESVLWELNNITRVLPVLADAEAETWTDAEAGRKWSETLADLGVLSGDGMIGDDNFRIALAVASVAFVDQARQRLLDGGIPESRLKQLPGLQIVLIDAARELRRVGDDLGKAYLLPTSLAKPLFEQQDKEFQEWLKHNRLSSVAAAISSILYPAVAQAKDAETRTVMAFNRLMTLEALRMYAAANDGAVPESLNELDPVPAMPDPYTNRAFGYRVERPDGTATVTLTSVGPSSYRPLQTLRARIVKK